MMVRLWYGKNSRRRVTGEMVAYYSDGQSGTQFPGTGSGKTGKEVSSLAYSRSLAGSAQAEPCRASRRKGWVLSEYNRKSGEEKRKTKIIEPPTTPRFTKTGGTLRKIIE
ncbi:hypothetical protein ACH5RR_015552 [Cinchona calisaya]|uniref:Uncharacterized protein n=1 Tax=Cinchona calisaya TaxID=153742 RepID=A0ABD2ZTV3_9GENT